MHTSTLCTYYGTWKYTKWSIWTEPHYLSQRLPKWTAYFKWKSGAGQAVSVSPEHNLKHRPPPYCLLTACYRSQVKLDSIHTPHCVAPGECGGHFSWQTAQVCVFRDTVCLPACLEGPAEPVNTTELWGPSTCRGQVQVSWDVFTRVICKWAGLACLCTYILVCVYKWANVVRERDCAAKI